MIALEPGTLAGLMLASALGGALACLLPGWRRLMVRGGRRPLWDFLAREGIERPEAEARLGARPVLCADLGCSMCDGKVDCERQLAAGEAPIAGCPNAWLFKALAPCSEAR